MNKPSYCAAGKRTDLERLRAAITTDPGNDLAIVNDPVLFPLFLRHHNAIAKVRLLIATPNPDPPFICVLLGESGAGKSRLVKEFCVPYFRFASSDGWWDAYDGQDTIFIDDMDGSSMQFRLLLQVLDSNCPRTKVKGGFVQPFIREVYITTNVHPINWYSPKVTAKSVWDLRHPLCRRLEQYGEMRVLDPFDADDPIWPPRQAVHSFRNPAFYHMGMRPPEPGEALRRPAMAESLYGVNMTNE